jgi:hypothetical protein
MLQLILLVIVLAAGTTYIVIGGKRADRARLNRFSDREDVSFDRFYAEHYEALGFDRARVARALSDVAQEINVSTTKLRPADRFDVELAAERGWEFDDGIAVLGRQVVKQGHKLGNDGTKRRCVLTLDDYIRMVVSR